MFPLQQLFYNPVEHQVWYKLFRGFLESSYFPQDLYARAEMSHFSLFFHTRGLGSSLHHLLSLFSNLPSVGLLSSLTVFLVLAMFCVLIKLK